MEEWAGLLAEGEEALVRGAWQPAPRRARPVVAAERRYDPDNVFRGNQNIARPRGVAPVAAPA
jgi:hypothetical protein